MASDRDRDFELVPGVKVRLRWHDVERYGEDWTVMWVDASVQIDGEEVGSDNLGGIDVRWWFPNPERYSRADQEQYLIDVEREVVQSALTAAFSSLDSHISRLSELSRSVQALGGVDALMKTALTSLSLESTE